MFSLQKKLKNLPDKPGIYLFFNIKNELIYVGKATSLKSRVKSYFAGQKTFRPIEEMIDEVKDIKVKITDSVLEAVILEAIYIKKFNPKYNVKGKDDKSWQFIVLTKENFPRLETLRQHDLKQLNEKEIKQKYKKVFGPFPGLKTKEAISLLRKIFHFSDCRPGAKRACLYYEIGQCEGVCADKITSTEYKQKIIRPLILFLSGKKKTLLKGLAKEMKQASKQEKFEEAARIRNQIFHLEKIQDIALINKSFIEDLDTKNELKRVEGYDISNLGKTGVVGSMVVFTNGEADKKEYKKFKIKTFTGQSDVGALEEIIRRRLRHTSLVDLDVASSDLWPLPNVFLIDGGKPQVNKVKKVLAEYGTEIPVVGIAKGAKRKKNEFIFDQIDYKLVEQNKELFIKVRDEAHRFAITYQKKIRKIKR